MDEDRTELLEIYKLHAELADRVSQRREGANRLYVSLLTGLFVFLAAMVRYGAEAVSVWVGLLVAGILGLALSSSWYIVIRSYRQLNTGKFKVLGDLEDKLAFPFFRREWKVLEAGENRSKYWRLTVVETFLPLLFGVISLALVLVSLVGCFPRE